MVSSTNEVSNNMFGQPALDLLDTVFLAGARVPQTDVAFHK